MELKDFTELAEKLISKFRFAEKAQVAENIRFGGKDTNIHIHLPESTPPETIEMLLKDPANQKIIIDKTVQRAKEHHPTLLEMADF